MNSKFFRQLPATLHRYVGTLLNSSDASHLAQTSSDFRALSNQAPLAMEQRKPLKKFLGHVVRGEREPMQEMLQQNPQLLVQRDAVTDCSGRNFDSISGFEYALWALDKHLWDDMLAFLPRDEQGHLTEAGQTLVTRMLRQLEQVTNQKITYMLNGNVIKESHYDFAIIAALRIQVNAQNAPGEKNREAINEQWREEVGSAQRLAPMHVVDEYCSDTPFFPVPKFNSRPRPAHGLRQFYNWLSLTTPWEAWFGLNSKLGFKFAIYKGAGLRDARLCPVRPLAMHCTGDFDAMVALCDTRIHDFTLLEIQLHFLLNVEEQPRPGGM